MAKKAFKPATRPTFAKAKPQKKVDYPAFLTADDLNAAGTTRFRIESSITIYQRDNGQTSLFVQVMRQDKSVFTWSLRANGRDRIALQHQHGRNILDWPGKLVELEVGIGAQGGRFVNLHDDDYQPTKQSRQAKPADDDIPF